MNYFFFQEVMQRQQYGYQYNFDRHDLPRFTVCPVMYFVIGQQYNKLEQEYKRKEAQDTDVVDDTRNIPNMVRSINTHAIATVIPIY